MATESASSIMKISGDFGHLDVLKGIPPAHQHVILAQCTAKHYKKGLTVFKQGDRANFVAFVGKGQAITLYHAPNGRIGASGIWTVGDILGASYIHNPTIRHTTVKCIEPMTLFCLPHANMLRLMRQFPEFGEAMLNAVSSRLRWAHHLTHIVQTLPAFERLCAILVSLSDRYGIQIADGVLVEVSLTHENIAALVGVTRQFATVTLHELVEEGLITIRERKVVVHDQKRLRRLAAVF